MPHHSAALWGWGRLGVGEQEPVWGWGSACALFHHEDGEQWGEVGKGCVRQPPRNAGEVPVWCGGWGEVWRVGGEEGRGRGEMAAGLAGASGVGAVSTRVFTGGLWASLPLVPAKTELQDGTAFLQGETVSSRVRQCPPGWNSGPPGWDSGPPG